MSDYVDSDGKYLGAFVGGTVNGEPVEAIVPQGAIAVPVPPEDARQMWDGNAWSAVPPEPPIITATAFLDRMGQDGPALFASPFGFALIRLAAAGSIKLDDPDVAAGMQAAVAAGAITKERATELLLAPR